MLRNASKLTIVRLQPQGIQALVGCRPLWVKQGGSYSISCETPNKQLQRTVTRRPRNGSISLCARDALVGAAHGR